MAPSSHRSGVVQPLPPDAPRRAPESKTKVSGDAENEEQPLLQASEPENVHKSEIDRASSIIKRLNLLRMTRAKGLGFIVFAGLNFSFASICIKYASHRVTSHETVFWRMVIALVLNYIWARYKKRKLVVESKYRGLLLLRCVVGTVGVNLQFYAMSKMVLTDAIVIVSTSPISTFFLGAAFLKEKINQVDLLAGITSFIGVMFVTRPAFLFASDTITKQAPPLATYCAIGASLTSAVVYILLRQLSKVDCLVSIHYFFVVGTCTSIVTLLVMKVSMTILLEPIFLFALFGSGFFSFIGQIFITKGFQLEQAGIASVMRYFDVVFVVAMDVLVLGEMVSLLSLLGAGIIMAGVSMIVLRRAREQ
ncbi:drug metabolite transporter superfamily [Plasmopara halstedii]|uniref:Drug metabolite transporter superfamily n=1 Tax=Plasmopara halstedii TaxID=4781 RepID=A0A0N7L467_PLAHL|nr:drug metabolite transporter superfamily [Plasmopara halstedii]CEG37827.1 drug metabolite transporter superfamily [Plasmopara halstedii]|eukprot:XP_024574196.1 drug metabolite transporter superfamily [Plasmopara halstedii]